MGDSDQAREENPPRDVPERVDESHPGGDGQDTDSNDPPVHPSQIRYLVFSGGGGKAFAYLGALAALAEFGLLTNPRLEAELDDRDDASAHPDDYFLDPERIAGVAGTSAGAITAALLAGKVGIRQAYELLTDEREVTRFFDDARVSTVETPTLAGVEAASRPRREQRMLAGLMGLDAAKTEAEEVRSTVRAFLEDKAGEDGPVADVLETNETIGEWTDANLRGRQLTEPSWLVGFALQRWNDATDTGIPPRTIREVFQRGRLPLYAAELAFHEGAFTGDYAREYVEDGIRAGLSVAGRDDPGDGLTFEDLTSASDIELVVVGADVESGRAGAFGTGQTPEVSVADAVRLSVALPFVYKPTVVESGAYEGVWLDGGLVNNFPFHAFEPDGLTASPTVLGLRLDPPTGPIDDLYDFGAAIGGTLFARTTENQLYTPAERDQVISVPTGGLTTLGFTPDGDTVEAAMVGAAQQVFEYFGEVPDNAAANAEQVIDERIYGNRPAPPEPDAAMLDVPLADELPRRYSRGYVEGRFIDEMLEKIKAGITTEEGWEPHPLAFLLDPVVRRADASGDPANPDELVDPVDEPETYRKGVSFWDRSTTPRREDFWNYADEHRRPAMDAGHMTSRWYLKDGTDEANYEYERFALEDKYLNIRIRSDYIEKRGAWVEDPQAVDIAGVPVERETAQLLEFDVDPAEEGYHEMSPAEQATFRKRYFPVDVDFPDHKPFGGVLGGLPPGTVDQKLADDETTYGWVYFGPYTDERRIDDIVVDDDPPE